MRTFKEISSQLLTILQHPILKRGVVVLLLLPFLLCSLWFISFGFFMGWVSLGLFVFALYKYNSSILKALLFIALWFGINIAFLPFTVNTYEKSSNDYFRRVQKGERLTFRENCNIYVLNIVIGIGAYPMFPEIAIETLGMMFPQKERLFHNDFFMKSRKIKEAFKKHPTATKVHVYWPARYYLDVFSGEARIAYALNACDVYRNSDGSFRAEVPVRYPEESHTLLIPFPVKIYIQEGLIHYLQDIGWLHTYKAIYVSN